MPARRTVLLALTAVAAAAAGSGRAWADTAAAAATAFIDKLLDDLAVVLNGSELQQNRRARLASIVDSAVDAAAVARFCIGRFWPVATTEQRRDYLELFHRVLLTSVTGRLGEYKGVTYALGRTTPRDGDFVVSTIVTRPGDAPNNVDWLVSMASGSPKIVDLIAEGISLRMTQRSDYATYLARNNYDVQSLINAMRQQAKGVVFSENN